MIARCTPEISRLQNSLQHLRQTQDLLREDIESDPKNVDAEVKAAYEENEHVIPAQEERITILKMALTEKGIVMGKHYDSPESSISSTKAAPLPSVDSTYPDEDENGPGIHL
ncbi:hypothetical protein AAF712_001893 [Marasmius tenuissimus]|uniref:Uncharacterized protein n=1 Tax=Marasmius tenuissimus TaxID=585030 RepID=A0ABR3ABE1_9AGAR